MGYTCFMLVNREELALKIRKTFPFNQLSDSQVESLTEHCEMIFFESEKMVFREGASALYLYIVYEGEIEILKEQEQSLIPINFIGECNIFGEEVFGETDSRQTSARTKNQSLLVRIDKKILADIASSTEKLQRAFSVLFRSYQALIQSKIKNGCKRETIYFLGRPHHFTLFLSIFILFGILSLPNLFLGLLFAGQNIALPALLLSLFGSFMLLLIWGLWRFLEWRNDRFVFTGKRVVSRNRKLLQYDQRFETPLRNIVNLNIHKSILGRSMDFGDLFIKTFTGASRLRHVPNVETVQSYLEFLWGKELQDIRLEERSSFEKIIKDRSENVETSSGRKAGEGYLSSEIESDRKTITSGKRAGINDRREDAFVYRTHWLMLIIKTIFPSLILMSIFLLLIYLTANGINIGTYAWVLASFILVQIGVLLWWLYQFFDWRNDRYLITRDQIIDVYQKPFGFRDQRTAPIINIQSIRYERRGIFGLMFNFGTVFIRVGDEEFTFDKVPNPAGVQEKLFSAFENLIAQKNKKDLTEQQQRVADWIETYHRVKGTEEDFGGGPDN